MDPDRSLYALVGRRLVTFREAAGLSQAQVAARVGITQPGLSYWERGMRDVPLQFAVRLAAVFQTEVTTLLSVDDLGRETYLRASRGPDYLA